jgi:uncharacterized protein YlxW (UPF0749 family)
LGTSLTPSGSDLAVDGIIIKSPWTISVIGDPTRLGLVAGLMTQQLGADRRVRSATYRVEGDILIRSVISEKPFVYAVPS